MMASVPDLKSVAKVGGGSARLQGATTRNSWRYSEEEQRSQRRRDAPEFGDGLRIRDTRARQATVPWRKAVRFGSLRAAAVAAA